MSSGKQTTSLTSFRLWNYNRGTPETNKASQFEVDSMKAVKAVYQNGLVTLTERPAERGPVDVLVVFPEAADDSWDRILEEKTPRPAFAKFMKKCLKEIKQGKAKPLDIDQL